MKIIDNYSYIRDFSVDADFFKKNSTVKGKFKRSRYWKVSKGNSFTLVNDISFFAFEKESKEVFLKYEGRLLLNAAFTETGNDVEEVLEQIKFHISSMREFIFNNSLTFYNKIDEFLSYVKPSQRENELIRDEIEQLKSWKKYEELSDNELYYQENRPRFIVKL